jgi:hypothetical protein
MTRRVVVIGLAALALAGVGNAVAPTSAQARPVPEPVEEPYYGPGDYYKPVRQVAPPTRAIVFNNGSEPVIVSSGIRPDGTNEAMLLQPGTSSANRIHDVVRVWAGETQCVTLNKPGQTVWVDPGEIGYVSNGVWEIVQAENCSF